MANPLHFLPPRNHDQQSDWPEGGIDMDQPFVDRAIE